MAASKVLPELPVAPFNDGGRGTYSRDAALMDDIELARRCLNDPRWPITATMRSRVVEWLETIMECADDDRTRLNAIKSILSADKLNLEQAKLMLECERTQRKLNDPATVVNINTGDTIVNNTFNRIDQLAAAFAGAADRSCPGTVPGDDPRKPVDT